MPIEYKIDHERRMVRARGCGILTTADFFGYQREVWSRSELAGYNELVDMREVEKIVSPSSQSVQELASLSASMDASDRPSKFAIVAVDPLSFGLGRMYEMHRELNERSTKTVAVFRSMDEVLQWLDEKP